MSAEVFGQLDQFDRFSPSNYIDKWSTPELLLHGMKDFRVPYTESLAAFHALQKYEKSLIIQ